MVAGAYAGVGEVGVFALKGPALGRLLEALLIVTEQHCFSTYGAVSFGWAKAVQTNWREPWVRCVTQHLPLLLLISACVSSEPQIDPSTNLSTDPVLTSVLRSFEAGCIANAPTFAEANVRAAFAANQPFLGPGMAYIASGDGDGSCRDVTVKGLCGTGPMPTVGDTNRLGQSLASRLGGSLKPKSADTSAGSAQVRRKWHTSRYNVFAFVSPDGTLTLSVCRLRFPRAVPML